MKILQKEIPGATWLLSVVKCLLAMAPGEGLLIGGYLEAWLFNLVASYMLVKVMSYAKIRRGASTRFVIRSGSYMDDLVYRNSPCDYMRNFPDNHPYKELYAKADKFIMCCGQGAWEGDLLASTLELQGILESKGIHPIVDIWGYDVAHDWVWWEKQWTYFLQMTLDDKK